MSSRKVRLEGATPAPLPARAAARHSLFMPPCHTVPFMRPGVTIDARVEPTTLEPPDRVAAEAAEQCDYCGSASSSGASAS